VWRSLRRDRDLDDVPQDRGAQIHDMGLLSADLVDQAAGIVLAAAQTGLRPAHHTARPCRRYSTTPLRRRSNACCALTPRVAQKRPSDPQRTHFWCSILQCAKRTDMIVVVAPSVQNVLRVDRRYKGVAVEAFVAQRPLSSR
jgi:hypothetical protein